MIIETGLRTGTGSWKGDLDVGHSSDTKNFVSIWQDDDLVLVYRDQVDALIEELKKFKENA